MLAMNKGDKILYDKPQDNVKTTAGQEESE